ncbi:hypothetical protein [Longimicrobium sp.]|uniref:hypothetical protein n=1 Tax=Longimicrobium sp. TaxID=2029185 RepID=UPI002CE7360E|nr:hypothetical protein [Longimicrobium sp.]HSU16542.1 hypothetical protein [Longimicrobium sp.]
MSERTAIRAALLALAVVAVAGWSSSDPPPQVRRWQHYCAEKSSIELGISLTRAGQEGWELVGFERQASGRIMYCIKKPG